MTIEEVENSAKHCAKLGKDWVELDKDKFEWLIKENKLMKKNFEDLQDLAIWMTGCGFNFSAWDYFIQKRHLLYDE